MLEKQIELVKFSWSVVAAADPETVGSLFYNRLFEISPQVKPMFRQPIAEQSKKLLAMLGYFVKKLDNLHDIMEEVVNLAQRHKSYGVKPAHYVFVGEALLWTLEKGLGPEWNEELKEAWATCYTLLSSAMTEATEDSNLNLYHG